VRGVLGARGLAGVRRWIMVRGGTARWLLAIFVWVGGWVCLWLGGCVVARVGAWGGGD